MKTAKCTYPALTLILSLGMLPGCKIFTTPSCEDPNYDPSTALWPCNPDGETGEEGDDHCAQGPLIGQQQAAVCSHSKEFFLAQFLLHYGQVRLTALLNYFSPLGPPVDFGSCSPGINNPALGANPGEGQRYACAHLPEQVGNCEYGPSCPSKNFGKFECAVCQEKVHEHFGEQLPEGTEFYFKAGEFGLCANPTRTVNEGAGSPLLTMTHLTKVGNQILPVCVDGELAIYLDTRLTGGGPVCEGIGSDRCRPMCRQDDDCDVLDALGEATGGEAVCAGLPLSPSMGAATCAFGFGAPPAPHPDTVLQAMGFEGLEWHNTVRCSEEWTSMDGNHFIDCEVSQEMVDALDLYPEAAIAGTFMVLGRDGSPTMTVDSVNQTAAGNLVGLRPGDTFVGLGVDGGDPNDLLQQLAAYDELMRGGYTEVTVERKEGGEVIFTLEIIDSLPDM